MAQSNDIEIEILKQRVDALETRIRFLESNWLKWTKETTAIGQQVVSALLKEKNENTLPNN